MRLDDNCRITPAGWLLIAFCAIIVGALLVWAAVTLIVELWIILITI